MQLLLASGTIQLLLASRTTTTLLVFAYPRHVWIQWCGFGEWGCLLAALPLLQTMDQLRLVSCEPSNHEPCISSLDGYGTLATLALILGFSYAILVVLKP